MIRSLGFETPVMGDTYGHWEEDLYHSTITQKTGVNVNDPGANNPITITLDASDLDSDEKYYPRLYDIVTFPNETQGWISAITVTPGPPDTVALTIYPNQSTKTCGAVAALTELIITSSTFTEGSGMPDPAIGGVSYFDNDAQIIKETIGATGTELVNETWIEQFNAAGEFQGYYRKGQAELDHRMLLKIDGMFWVGERISTTNGRALNPVSGYVHKASQGLIPTIRQRGNPNSYTIGAFSVTDFDSYALTLESEFVPTTTPLWTPMGISLSIEVENELKDYLDNTNITYSRQAVNDVLFKGDDALAASVNFKYFVKANRTYLFSALPGFSNPTTFGASGYKFKNMGFIIPLEKRRDPKTKEDIPSIGMRYRAMGALNRRMITAKLAGIGAAIGAIPVHEIDKTNTYSFAHMGCHFMGVNRFILIDPT